MRLNTKSGVNLLIGSAWLVLVGIGLGAQQPLALLVLDAGRQWRTGC